MKRRQWGLYVIALAVLVVGLVWVGVPASTLLIGALVLVCPLMMFVMMRGMHSDNSHTGHDHSDIPSPRGQDDDRHGLTRL